MYTGWLSPLVVTSIGINHRKNASSSLFRRYLADLGNCITASIDVCFDEVISVHLLWEDDLTSVRDLQNNWIALPVPAPQIWWYWMKWMRAFLYLENNAKAQMLKISISKERWLIARRNINISEHAFGDSNKSRKLINIIMNIHVIKLNMFYSQLTINWAILVSYDQKWQFIYSNII